MPILVASSSLALLSSASAGSIYEELEERDQYSTLVAAIDAAGLADALSNPEANLTIFAPSNTAFAAVPQETLNALLGDPVALGGLLTYHVLPEELGASQLRSRSYTTLNGAEVEVEVRSFFGFFRTVYVNSNRVLRPNIHADNGVIHGIGAVLSPGDAPAPSLRDLLDSTENGNFSVLASLLDAQGLSDVLDSNKNRFTLFAPTDEVFAAIPEDALNALLANEKLLRQVLLNHVARPPLVSADLSDGDRISTLAGERLAVTVTGPSDPEGAPTIQIGDATVTIADVDASNGVLHVIDGVLLIPEPQSIVDLAQTRDDLETFVVALEAAGLVETFDTTTRFPSYTIFAPNDDAFEALPEGALNALVVDPAALGDVLGLHVVRGRYPASALRDGQVLHALNGERLIVGVNDGIVTINNATVAEANLEAENGIIHVVDSVIEEDVFTLADLIASKSYLSTLGVALDAASLTSALEGEDNLTILAPTNRAFDSLPDGVLEGLLADIPALANVLTYHVVPGSRAIADLAEEGSVATLQGSDVEVTSRTFRFWRWSFSIFRINDNYVIASNLEADNGVIHIIRGVLLPPMLEEGGDNDGEGE